MLRAFAREEPFPLLSAVDLFLLIALSTRRPTCVAQTLPGRVALEQQSLLQQPMHALLAVHRLGDVEIHRQ